MPGNQMTRLGSSRRTFGAAVLAILLMATASVWSMPAASAAVLRVDLRVLVLDDDSPWVEAIASQLRVEGVPYTALDIDAVGRAPITPAMLADGDHALFQAVVAPSAVSAALTAAEWTVVRSFEAKFSLREVDGYNWPSAAVGLQAPVWWGEMAGMTATATPAAQQSGFQYLLGPVPFGIGSYGYVAAPLTTTTTPAMPAGASFTPFLTAAPAGAIGSVIGVYTHDGLEQMVITTALAFELSQFKSVSHGIVTWMTRGVHLGYQRNYLSFHVDDAFSEVALWDPARNCTPGEDCPLVEGVEQSTARMTADDVAVAMQWQTNWQYTFTLAFNGVGIAAGDPLTAAFQTNQVAFKWLNHGLEHIYQGCVQDFTVSPWRCATDANGAVVWVQQADIQKEILDNVTTGRSIGLSFDATEYLSGEHSGLVQLPQQPVDSQNFIAAVAAAGITSLGADASRETGSRLVGTALTVPRHPTALYYNTTSAASAVDEYNWLYTSVANGGSGYCEANPATATCIAPLDPATGFTGYIVPTDAAFDLGFILSNDPRPFYAHTTNMTGDRLIYPLLEKILTTYRTTFGSSAPLVNLTLTQAATALQRQASWAATSDVTAYMEGRTITVSNPSGTAVPLTVPTGTTAAGLALEAYGGELSTWTSATTAVATVPASQLTIGGSTAFTEGRAGVLTARTTTPNATMEISGALPTGLTWLATGPGAYAVSGTPAIGSAGSYPIVITATSAAGVASRSLTIVVSRMPAITSAPSAAIVTGVPFSFTITSTGSPVPTVSVSGTLPSGLTVRTNIAGTATISGTPTFSSTSTYRLTVTARNSAGTATQALTLTRATRPVFTSTSSRTTRVGRSTSFTISTTATPVASLTALDPFPTGLTFRDRGDGTATVSGVPAAGTARTWTVRIRASNIAGATIQSLRLVVLP